MIKSLTIIVLLSASTQTFAEEAPKNPCHQPVMPNSQSSDIVIKYFSKHMREYKTCIDKFVKEQRAISTLATDVNGASKAFEAAEAAQKEYNAIADELNARTVE